MSFFFSRGFGRSARKNKLANSTPPQPAQSYPSRDSSHTPLDVSKNSSASSLVSQRPLFMCQPFVRTSLVKGSFQTIVMLPKYVDSGEWLAFNMFEFYTYLGQFVNMLAEFITPQTCPTMNAGPGMDYLWLDQNKKTHRLPANQYIETAMSWMSQKFDDQTLFPTQQGVPFPPHFTTVLKHMYRQMFRIFAHIYHNHFDKIVHLSLEAHWNSFFAHFISFGKTFDLADNADLVPLVHLIEALEAQGKITHS
uniref:ARAD1B01826p n=1 Tax=Blastobotrys adeninivorans TaxID=409370 RepID=A0A060T9S7_BLAAD